MLRNTSVLTVLSLIAVVAHADQEFSGVGAKRDYRCKDSETVTVSGVNQRISLSGVCGNLLISGTSNDVRVAQVETIDVEGTSNKIYYGSNAKGAKPSLKTAGTGNTVSADAGLRKINVPTEAVAGKTMTSSAPAAAMISEPDQCHATQTVEGVANGQSLHCEPGARILIEGVSIITRVSGNCAAICIDGTDNVITVEGDALAVAVSGTTNQVRAARVDAVSLSGMNNSVSYHTSLGGQGPKKDQPKVATDGMHNSVARQ